MHTSVYTKGFVRNGVSDLSDTHQYDNMNQAIAAVNCLIDDISYTNKSLQDTTLAWTLRMTNITVTPHQIHTSISETSSVHDLMTTLTCHLGYFNDQIGVCDRIRDIIRGYHSNAQLKTTLLASMSLDKEIVIIEKINRGFSVISIQFSRGETSWYDWLLCGNNIAITILIAYEA